MGQEHSCQTSLRTAAGSTVSTTADKVQRTGEDIAGTANAMAERSDSLPLPDSDSTTIDSPAERTGSSDKDDFSSEPLEPDTPNTTLPPSDALEEQLRPRRELRPSNDFKRVIPSTWIDADDTGDFDPQEENRRSRPCRKRTKLSHRKRFDWTGENTTARLDARPQIKTKPEPEPEPPLCLRFKSSFGKTAFRVLCATLQDEVTPARDHFNEGYELRRRNAVSDGSSLDNARATTTGLRVLAAEQNCDYSNHPMARGCLKCMASGLECSLLEDEHSWPCNDCKLEDFECQLFQVIHSRPEAYRGSQSDDVHRNLSTSGHARIVSTLGSGSDGSCVPSNTVRTRLSTKDVVNNAKKIATNLASQALAQARHGQGCALVKMDYPSRTKPRGSPRRLESARVCAV